MIWEVDCRLREFSSKLGLVHISNKWCKTAISKDQCICHIKTALCDLHYLRLIYQGSPDIKASFWSSVYNFSKPLIEIFVPFLPVMLSFKNVQSGRRGSRDSGEVLWSSIKSLLSCLLLLLFVGFVICLLSNLMFSVLQENPWASSTLFETRAHFIAKITFYLFWMYKQYRLCHGMPKGASDWHRALLNDKGIAVLVCAVVLCTNMNRRLSVWLLKPHGNRWTDEQGGTLLFEKLIINYYYIISVIL